MESEYAFDGPFAERLTHIAASETVRARDLFEAIAAQLIARAGIKLVTVTAVDPKDSSFERLYTSMPDIYPVAGRKPPNRSHWSDHVITRREPFLANTYAELAAVMPDHETIRSIGCESILNLPVVCGGRVHGTLNCLAGPEHFTPQRQDACASMCLPTLLGLVLPL